MIWCLTNTAGGTARPAEDVERQGDQAAAVFLGKVAHRRDEGRARLSELGARVGFGVLADDGTAVGTAGFLEGARGAERAGVVGGADQNPAAPSTRASACAPARAPS